MAANFFNKAIRPFWIHVIAVIKSKASKPILPFVFDQHFDRYSIRFSIHARVWLLRPLSLAQPRELTTTALQVSLFLTIFCALIHNFARGIGPPGIVYPIHDHTSYCHLAYFRLDAGFVVDVVGHALDLLC